METLVPTTPEPSEEATTVAAPVIDQEKLDLYMHRLRLEQNLPKAVVAGLLAATIAGMAWGTITYVTQYQIGIMAVGVGLLVGYAVRTVGQGLDKIFGIMGALFALLGCLIGNYLYTIGFIADEMGLNFLNTFTSIDLAVVPELMVEVASPMDLLFYGIALYEGYKFSFRQLTEQEILANATPMAAASAE